VISPRLIAELRLLHAKARAGVLTPEEVERYRAAREEVNGALMAAQHLLAQPNAKARRAFRGICERDIEIEPARGVHKSRTLGFSVGGFSALLDIPLDEHEKIGFALWLRGAKEPLHGHAICRGMKHVGQKWRCAFEFDGLGPREAERLEMEVIDLELEMLWPSAGLTAD